MERNNLQNLKKIVIIQPNMHRLYWGWYKALNEIYDLYLIFPSFSKECQIPFLVKEKIFFLEGKNRFKYDICLKGLTKILKKINPDIIISKIIYMSYTLEAYRFARKQKKYFYIIEEIKNYPPQYFYRLLFKIYFFLLKKVFYKTPIFCVTLDSYKFLKDHKFHNVYYIPCFLLKTHRNACISNNKNIFHDKKIKLLYVGRLVDIKNIMFVLSTLVKALDRKIISKEQIEFTIVGDGPLKKQIVDFCSKNKISDIVRLTGFINNEQLNKVYKSHNLFILPSQREPVGLVTLEAMSNSLPIIVSKNAGVSSYILPYFNGIIIDPNLLEDLLFALQYYKNSQIREEHSRNSFLLFQNIFCYEKGKEILFWHINKLVKK